MGTFSYRAATSEGRVVEGILEADGEAAVVASLRQQGYIPLEVVAGTSQRARRRSLALGLPAWPRRGRIRSRDLMLFTRELATLLRAGMPLDRSLQSLAALGENERMRRVVGDVLSSVQEGKSLSDALAEHAEVFPPLYINMVRAGEAGGVVESVLERLAEYLERSERARDEIRSAMTYPIILALVGSASIVVLLVYVLPKFTTVFADLGAAMPASTRLVMAASDALERYWWIGVGLLIAAGVGLRQYVSTREGRVRVDRWTLSLPVLGDLVRKIQIARMARTLGTMLKSGVPLIRSLDIVRAIVGNVVIASALEAVQRDVSEGKGLAQPLERTGVFPALPLQMIAVGEETGRLDDMLLIVADHYDREVTNAVARLMSMVEPAMLLLMGLITGFIVIAMLSAVFSVNQVTF
ncbi:MAG: type II secretion system F family protein [Candidatus Dadabacteria bacterium]|nr:MAG: type II secretion system F family protein [Candidatus Dadabacteria bacterium]